MGRAGLTVVFFLVAWPGIEPHAKLPSAQRTNGEGRNRTGDTTVFSRVLYRLSYLAAAPQCSRESR